MNLKELDSFILEDLLNISHPSIFTKRDDYSLLILRLPEINSCNVELNSYAFIIQNNTTQIYNRDKKELQNIGTLDDLTYLIDEKIEKLLQETQKYHINIDNLEESLYDSNIQKDFMQTWLSYKKDVSLINRLMFHASIAFELYENYTKKLNIKFNEMALTDLSQEISRVKELSKSAMDKLDNLYDFYRAKVDEKMNRNVYYLTLLSGLFLPLTLVTGFFGMNTGGLPFIEDTNGTLKVVVISIVLELIFFLPFFILNRRK